MNCKNCGAALPAPAGTGRPKKFCGDDCRLAHYRKNLKDQGRNEWYSPPDIVAAAKRVMGGIDLDPASCYHANEIVGASRYYTKSDDGLRSDLAWRGRVWLNPPYDKFAPKFFAKFCEEYEAGNVWMACLLLGVHHLTTKWFQRVEGFTSILCLPAGRLRFSGRLAYGNEPMHGSAILGVGVNPDFFRQEFSEFGMILDMCPREIATAHSKPAPLVVVK